MKKIDMVEFHGQCKTKEMLDAHGAMKRLSPLERGVVVSCIRRNSMRTMVQYVTEYMKKIRKDLSQ